MSASSKTFAIFLIILAAVFSVFAQNPTPKKSLEIAVINAKPEDVGTIEGIVKAFYEVISGDAGEPRQWSRDKTLYVPEIRFTAVGERNGKVSVTKMNHQQYVDGSNDFFVKEGFVEKEIHRIVRRFKNTAHVFSTYEFTTSGKQKISGRGLNSIELFFDGNRWWISAVGWEEESPNNPIPKEFLP